MSSVPDAIAATNRAGSSLASRVQSADLLRGVVMVIMALDHVRDFFTKLRFLPEDMTQTYGTLFFTRWITHFCAPSFFFLAGLGAFFYSRNRPIPETSRFLWKRGLWLIFLEMTVIFWGWSFLFPLPGPTLLVIWALGASMIVLSFMIRLPLKWVGVFGVSMIVLHNLTDTLVPAASGTPGLLWGILHKPGFYPINIPVEMPKDFPQFGFFVLYPLIPWIGVMAAGFALGALYTLPADERRRKLIWIGSGAFLLFVVLRATNGYGNPPAGFTFFSPGAFEVQKTAVLTVISFFNVEKYPPSLQFLLMTLGPAILALAWFERFRADSAFAGVQRFFVTIGKVPMFFYILHLYLIHTLAILCAKIFHQQIQIMQGPGAAPPGIGLGFELPFIYLMWALVITILYFPCRWYAGYKATHKKWWLSYV